MPALQRVAGYQRANGVAGGAIAVAAPCAPGKDRDDLATTPVAPGAGGDRPGRSAADPIGPGPEPGCRRW